MEKKNLKILFFGAGVIGGSVGAWIAPHYDDVYFLDMGAMAEAMKSRGITHYLGGAKEKAENVKVKVVDSLDQIKDADVIVLGVKNYSLDGVAKSIKDKVGDRPLIVSMANGMDNQRILPQYFSKVIYCIVSYNGWMDEPGVIGYQKRGPLILGTPDNGLQEEMAEISRIFNLGVETVITPHFQDAVHSKIIINLSNSVLTLAGHGFREISDPDIFRKLVTGLLYEGMQVVKAAGFKECKLGGMPSWMLLSLTNKLPAFIIRPLFAKNLAKMVVSSMAQDVLMRKGHQTELDSINGRIIELADKNKLPAPFNRTIYELCKREFIKDNYKPLDVKEIWAQVPKRV